VTNGANGPEDARRIALYRRLTTLAIAVTAVACVVGIAVPAGLGWDFANFYDAGRRVAAGQIENLYNPDSFINGRPPQGTTGFFGAPISALFYVPLAALTPEAALVVFKIENVVAFAATFAILFAFYRPFTRSDREARAQFAALFAFMCLIYQPFWTIFRVGGQTTPTVLLCLTLGLVFHTKARFWGSAICVVLAALIKPALAPAILFLACVSGLAFLWRIAAVLIVTGLLSLAAIGWPAHAAFLDLMSRSSRITYAWYFNSSIYILIDNLRLYAGQAMATGALRPVLSGLTYALKGAVAAMVVVLLIRSRREAWPDSARRHFDFTLAVLFFLLWSPTVWEHYLSMLFLFLTYVVAARQHFSRQALATVAAIFVLSIAQNLILINWVRYHVVFDSLPELVGVALVKSGPLLLTMALLWRHAGELFRSYAAPAWERHPMLEPGPAPRVAS
jgi:hypothetical protein